jgi:hypothetical protein
VDNRERHLNRLRIAEQQFRLACTVNLAVTNGIQTLDVPVEWTFGKHRVTYQDFGLRGDQAENVGIHLEMTSTLVLASIVRDAIVAVFENPKAHANPNVVAAYQISRMIRNAFAHSMLFPRWSIDEDCRNRVFAIEGVISLDTSDLYGKMLEWRDYGGPLAIFYFGRFVREALFGDKIDPNRKLPPRPTVECYQQCRLIAKRVESNPEKAGEVIRVDPGDSLYLGGGHWLRPPQE